MQIDILTTFPKMFSSPFSESIIKRAQEKNILKLVIHDLRDYATGNRKTTDDRPYGGGPGMVMMIEPIDKALENIKRSNAQTFTSSHVILTSAKGTRFTQSKAQSLSTFDQLIIICGHFEGVDERVAKDLCDEEVSIGDYVLTGGEIPAMVMVDGITRLLPGVLGEMQSIVEESHSQPGYLEYPQYTRPEVYKGSSVPKVLLQGNHANIKSWRLQNSKTDNS